MRTLWVFLWAFWVMISCSDAVAQYKTGLVMPKNWSKNVFFAAPPSMLVLPPSFDWREKMVLSPIKNQGSCGSCWAFSLTATLSDSMAVKNKGFYNMSQQFLVSCNKKYGFDYGCQGGFLDAADMFARPGAVRETLYPYTGRDSACKTGLQYQFKIRSWAFIPGGTETTPPPVEAIKAAIYQYGPVSVGVMADNNMQSYKSGIFSKCSNGQLNHAVNIVGWGPGYWIVRNSWGVGFGEKGFIRMKWGCNGIGTAAMYMML